MLKAQSSGTLAPMRTVTLALVTALVFQGCGGGGGGSGGSGGGSSTLFAGDWSGTVTDGIGNVYDASMSLLWKPPDSIYVGTMTLGCQGAIGVVANPHGSSSISGEANFLNGSFGGPFSLTLMHGGTLAGTAQLNGGCLIQPLTIILSRVMPDSAPAPMLWYDEDGKLLYDSREGR